MCAPPSLARSCHIWTHLSVPAIPAPGAVWPTTGPKGHPSGWLVHPLSAHHHLPSPSGTLCMCVCAHVFQIQPHFCIWMCPSILASHLGGPFHHLSALVAPIFLWVGYPLGTHHTLFPPFQLLHIHVHPLWPTWPPPRLHAHLHTLPHTSAHLVHHFFLGFSYTHSTSCALAHSHLYPMAHG